MIARDTIGHDRLIKKAYSNNFSQSCKSMADYY